MTTDKMQAEFEAWAKAKDLPIATYHFGATWSYVDLRTAWAFEGWRVRKAEREAVQKEALHQLVDEAQELDIDDAMLAAEAYLVANKHEKELLFFSETVAVVLAAEVERLRAELPAAKAASVCPVEIRAVYVNKYLGSVVVFVGNEKGALEFEAWLTKRQDKSPPQS